MKKSAGVCPAPAEKQVISKDYLSDAASSIRETIVSMESC